jgi:hypothetical protein
MKTQQMELGFGEVRAMIGATGQSRRMGRAAWWFDRMRQIVQQAIDWEAAPAPRPEQIWFPGAHRQVQLGNAAGRGVDLDIRAVGE